MAFEPDGLFLGVSGVFSRGEFRLLRNTVYGRNQMEGRAPSRPSALGTRPRQSVALQPFWKHGRKKRTSYAVGD